MRCLPNPCNTSHTNRGIESKFKNDGIGYVLGKLINDVECAVNKCNECSEFHIHKDFEIKSREEYKRDKNTVPSDDTIVIATDMQKIVMLLRIPGVETAIFTKRLTTYHMTFAPVGGKSQENGKPVGVIWHEAIMGRNDEDVTSTYAKYIEYMRDKTRFLFWVDNCSAQNKNWTLYTTFCFLVKSPDYGCKEIIVKYFQPGHTFMAADAFHKQSKTV